MAEHIAVVTGGASGIGEALCRHLAADGAHVIVADRDLPRATSVAESIGSRAEAASLDVTDAEAFGALIDRVFAERGRLDYLFNNAGIGLAGETHELTIGDWRRVVEVNLMGTIHGIHAAYPRMRAQGFGHIVNTASGAGLGPRPGMVAYAATKHAVVGLSTSLRAEAEAYGVKVSAICPGYVQTRIVEGTHFKNVDGEALMKSVPIRPISAEECARRALAGVRANRAIITITAYETLDWWLYRVSPALSLRAASFRARAFREHRKEK